MFVLTYHSHHIAGTDYATNDHVALAIDLGVIDAAGYRIVPLAELLELFLAMQRHPSSATVRGEHASAAEARVVALTFDDGPEYDAVDHRHPTFGLQRSFLNILEEFAATSRQAGACGTSFVIASPEARRCMEAATGPGAYYLHEGALNDDWWSAAIDSGRLAIANHSWDHLHPALPQVAHSRQAKGDFTAVDNAADAVLQIDAATRYIDRRTGGRRRSSRIRSVSTAATWSKSISPAARQATVSRQLSRSTRVRCGSPRTSGHCRATRADTTGRRRTSWHACWRTRSAGPRQKGPTAATWSSSAARSAVATSRSHLTITNG